MSATVTVNTEGIDELLRKLKSLETIDFMPLMLEWGEILQNDNREGALAGLDGFGEPLEPVTYRPNPNKHKLVDYSIQENNNLTSAHYRTLDGPPLAPRREESRVVTQFRVKPEGPLPDGRWQVLGGWEDFLSIEGLEILPFHFDGPDHNPRLPIRDLAHVRPGALQKARDALTGFIQKLLQSVR